MINRADNQKLFAILEEADMAARAALERMKAAIKDLEAAAVESRPNRAERDALERLMELAMDAESATDELCLEFRELI